MSLIEWAKRTRPLIVQAAQSLPDKEASEAPLLYDPLRQSGELIRAGTKIRWGSIVKRAAVDLWDRLDQDPDHAPELWEDLLYREGVRVIPESITPGMAFSRGERGWWDGRIWESVLDPNTWTPAQHPKGWREVVQDA